MKYLFTICLFSISLCLAAQDIVWLTPKEHDFGEFEQFDLQQSSFKFKNNTDEPIVIDNVRPACGCTSPEWSNTPIMPDSTGIITIEYDARKMGYFYKKVKVFFSNARKGHKLYVQGTVVDEI